MTSRANAFRAFVKGGDTAACAALDISKAFDRANHSILLMKLMKRGIPMYLLNMLDHWLANSWSCVKWDNIYSSFFRLQIGVRQGSVLAPVLFAIYINEILLNTHKHRYGYVLAYADDILLIARTCSGLQALFDIVESEINSLNLSLNVKKSCCMRIGPRFNSP